ncbi:MAG: hypothetical protein ACRDZU_12325 [Acidimicrobiales bacterium]
MRRTLLPLILGGALSIAAIAPAAAAPSAGGLANAQGLIAAAVNAIVQVEDTLNDTTVNVLNIDVSNSLNNLLRNANIEVLKDVLNNSLNNLSVDVTVQDITVVGDSVVITVLGTTGVADLIVLG